MGERDDEEEEEVEGEGERRARLVAIMGQGRRDWRVWRVVVRVR